MKWNTSIFFIYLAGKQKEKKGQETDFLVRAKQLIKWGYVVVHSYLMINELLAQLVLILIPIQSGSSWFQPHGQIW